MADSWLQLANKNTGAPYLNRWVAPRSSTHPWPRPVPEFISVWESVEYLNPPFPLPPPTLLRIHIEEINQTVLMHMTEKMNYKHSEVLSAVLTNRACHTLAVYFLLNKKMKRLSKEYRVSPLSNTLFGMFDLTWESVC